MTVDLLGPASDQSVTVRPGRSITRLTADTWFKDCTSPDAEDGTSYTADFFNDMLAQMRTAMRSAGIDLDNGDDMLWRAMQSVGIRYGVDTGAAGHLTVSCLPPCRSLFPGLALFVKAGANCPGATDVTPDGLTTKSLTWPDGSALAANDYLNGCTLLILYDGTAWRLIFKLNANTGAANFVPGCIYHWPLDTPPAGTLECDGSAIDRTTYARLFGVIGTAYGPGNGTSTFNLPDYRGQFLRGRDHGAGVDLNAGTRTNRGDGTTGDHAGTKQASAAGAISLSGAALEIDGVKFNDHLGGGWTSLMHGPQYNQDGASNTALFWATVPGGSMIYDMQGNVTLAGNSGAAETRPINVSTLIVIAY